MPGCPCSYARHDLILLGPKLDLDDCIEAVEQITLFKIAAGLPQTKGALNSKVWRVQPQRVGSQCSLVPCMLRASQQQVPSYSSSPMPGGISKWHGAVMLYCKGHRPKRRHWDLLWALKEWYNNMVCIFDVAPPVSCGEKTDFPHVSSFILHIFPPRTCTWSAVIGWNPWKQHLADDLTIKVQEGHSWQHYPRISPGRG